LFVVVPSGTGSTEKKTPEGATTSQFISAWRFIVRSASMRINPLNGRINTQYKRKRLRLVSSKHRTLVSVKKPNAAIHVIIVPIANNSS
jgi:hypothetical protein